jgi:predicted NUDIX family NTP pyrophosphohydrolase
MPRLSAGLLLYRVVDRGVQVLLVHPGGPFWARRDAGAWSVPKGEHAPDEEPRSAAEREFQEELGRPAPPGDRRPLGEVSQSGGKLVRAWAVDGDFDVESMQSNTFEMEWPRGSGRRRTFPEVDKAAWWPLEQAREKMVSGQRPFLDRLVALLADI